ncbi:von Willebrand factor D and EGF domain-containing protein-like isoform X3 [Pomacea canaliculata]|uniref:von Willebrand factor D and EGF domain-containing protein-like isoform X3 n=1 Tax=Pomacea canaliculata TaxID=400727 RepID=UPI000D7332FB|nr:von Willebrand factor D and EGF domain-containing protein-like isoform X3 [Pomacea canaliculata]
MGCAHTAKWFLPSLLLAFAALQNVAAQPMPDPCLHGNYKNLTNVHRSVSYETAYPETPLCDIDLDTGWYRFVVDAESKMPETCVDPFKCGTTVPIWLNCTHPSVSDGIQTRRACANLQAGGASSGPCCGQAVNIGVKNCEGFFVYYLHPTRACPMAYCAGKDAPCPAGKWSPTGFPPGCKDPYPQLTDPPKFRGPVIKRRSVYFTCDLTFSGNDPDQVFEFVWLFDGVEDPKVPPEVVRDPKRSARLDGAQLAGLLNKNVGCKVRAFYKQNVVKKGPWLESTRTYWAGIQTDPSKISIRTDEDKFDVVIRSTLPVLCNSSVKDDQCCVWIYLSVTGSEGDQAFLVVSKDCRYSICKSDWNSTSQEASKTVSVVASKTQMQYGTKDLLVSFENIVIADTSRYQRIFQGFKIPSVQVDLQQRDSKLCSIVTDPHITGLDDKRVFHLYRVGDYTAYENVQRDFEVQIRTWPCFQERPDRAVTCICGVAVREKDDVIRVNGCNHGFYGQSVGSPEITVPRPLREGTTILQSTDGSMITLYFPSSTEIQITASAILGGHLNLYISVPGTDYLNGRGLCGTFDNNPNNDLTHRSGFVDTMPADSVPEGFTESWKNDDSTSLFRIVPPETGESYVPQYCKCNNDGRGTVNCTYQGDINERKLPCPNCQDTTGKSGFLDGGWTSKRRKRSVSGKAYVDSDEIEQVYDPNDFADFRPPNLSWPTSTGISESQAENYCSNALRQSQLWPHCQDKRQEIEGQTENCKIDILVANNYTSTEAIVEAFQTNCKVELAKDPDNYITTPGGESVLKPEISNDVCNPVCYINGRCDRGQCVCNRGFIGDNCQIKDEPPKLLGLRGSNLCDFNERPCKQVFINAENIQNKETMACRIQEILDDGSVSERASMKEAVFLTLNKLGCFLPDAGIKTEKSIKRFYITATIDGHRYSNPVNMTVYDSSCQNCTQEGCWRLPSTCLINNLCFQDGELNSKDNSQICTVTVSTTEWSPVPTVRSDYPVIMSVNVTRSEDNTQLRCEVNADASKPTASFRMAWGVDGDWLRELVIPSGHLEAAISMSDVSHAHQVACRVRSVFTDTNIFSPYTYSNILSMGGR